MSAAPQRGAGTAQRTLQPEDLLALRTITDAQISPDGRQIAYALKTPDLERNEYRSAIYLVPTSGGAARQLSGGPGRDSAPRWPPTAASPRTLVRSPPAPRRKPRTG